MVSEQSDKTKLMAFIHGELDESEARHLSERMEKNSDLRREFELLSQVSNQLGKHYSAAPTEGLSDEQLQKIRDQAQPRAKFRLFPLFFGGALAAACAAILVVVFVFNSETPVQSPQAAAPAPPESTGATEGDAPVAPPSADLAASEPTDKPTIEMDAEKTEPPTAAMPITEPPTNVAAAPTESMMPANDGAIGQSIAGGSTPKKGAGSNIASRGSGAKNSFGGSQGLGGLAQGNAESKKASKTNAYSGAAPQADNSESEFDAADESVAEESDLSEDAGAAKEPPPSAPQKGVPPAAERTFRVVRLEAGSSPFLSIAQMLTFINGQLNGDSKCTAALPKDVTTVEANVVFTPKGAIRSLDVVPKSAATANCLKMKLRGKPGIFKVQGNEPGKLMILLRVR